MNGDIGIGRIITEERHRDAIHIAVAPMEALVQLKPAEYVAVHEGKATSAGIGTPVGIVDPFLAHVVLPGQMFYVFLFPGSITSLRHEWVHPAFEEAPSSVKPPMSEKIASEKWLREYAKQVNPYMVDGTDGNSDDEAYQTLMDDLANDRITYHGVDMHSRGDLIDAEELRHHAEIVLGRRVDYDNFEYFSCTC